MPENETLKTIKVSNRIPTIFNERLVSGQKTICMAAYLYFHVPAVQQYAATTGNRQTGAGKTTGTREGRGWCSPVTTRRITSAVRERASGRRRHLA